MIINQIIIDHCSMENFTYFYIPSLSCFPDKNHQSSNSLNETFCVYLVENSQKLLVKNSSTHFPRVCIYDEDCLIRVFTACNVVAHHSAKINYNAEVTQSNGPSLAHRPCPIGKSAQKKSYGGFIILRTQENDFYIRRTAEKNSLERVINDFLINCAKNRKYHSNSLLKDGTFGILLEMNIKNDKIYQK